MSKDDEYRKKAVECAEAADQVHDPLEKLQLLKLAQGWIKLAEHVRGQPCVRPRRGRDGHSSIGRDANRQEGSKAAGRDT